ncbi:hypothetical protein BOH66_01710 [Microbacterium aurum]|uniref:Uncharacterized protein n=1 Tax=Microbacterium aurum TaxID=36805 RepID=A0A1P8U4W7_9MICO|nr:DUF5996 family protein [Microbacterium aurum]APZ33155.1 hypothetical protein BOH66_01710 [Microbacterium aurum]MBM7826733.1 hypothetical protein [Microbacterium aurum]
MDERETRWPALRIAAWQDTRDTLQLWTQMVGKLRMALAPHQNHWWHVPLYVDARGLTTGLMPAGSLGLEVRFDVIAHELVFERTDGTVRAMALRPRSVADFSREFVTVLTALDVPARIHPGAGRAARGHPVRRGRDPRVVRRRRGGTLLALAHHDRADHGPVPRRVGGQGQPVHFFWGAFDLATSRFSGRPAPQHPGGGPVA